MISPQVPKESGLVGVAVPAKPNVALTAEVEKTNQVGAVVIPQSVQPLPNAGPGSPPGSPPPAQPPLVQAYGPSSSLGTFPICITTNGHRKE